MGNYTKQNKIKDSVELEYDKVNIRPVVYCTLTDALEIIDNVYLNIKKFLKILNQKVF